MAGARGSSASAGIPWNKTVRERSATGSMIGMIGAPADVKTGCRIAHAVCANWHRRHHESGVRCLQTFQMLSIVPEIAPDLADSPLILAPRVPRWFETRVFDDKAIDRVDEPVVRTPHQVLVEALLEQSSADLAWLAWEDGSQSVVVARNRVSPLQPSSIGEFPEPPRSPLTINQASRTGAWALWCRSRGILSSTVVPVRQRNEIVGTIGLASCTAGALDASDLQRVQLGASLAIQARSHELRLSSLRRMFDEVSRTLENALALDRALRLPPTYREIARSVGESLDASYCQIAVRDARQAITIRAGGGHRPPRRAGSTWTLAR